MHTSDNLDLGNAVAVAENDTNLRGSGALPGELADLVNDLVGGGLEPGRRAAGVGDGGGRDALSLAVEATVQMSMLSCRVWLQHTPYWIVVEELVLSRMSEDDFVWCGKVLCAVTWRLA